MAHALDDMVKSCHAYLDDRISVEQFKSEVQSAIIDCNANQLRSFAHVLSEYAIHLRDRGH